MKHIDNSELWNFISGSLPDERSAEIRRHLEVCDTCRMELQMRKTLESDLGMMQHRQPSLRFQKNILEVIERSKAIDIRINFWMRFTRRTMIGTAFLLLVSILTLGMTSIDFPIQMEMQDLTRWVTVAAIGSITLWAFYGIDLLLSRKRKA